MCDSYCLYVVFFIFFLFGLRADPEAEAYDGSIQVNKQNKTKTFIFVILLAKKGPKRAEAL